MAAAFVSGAGEAQLSPSRIHLPWLTASGNCYFIIINAAALVNGDSIIWDDWKRHGETLTYYAFPDSHWIKIRTNNPLERIMKEIRRRTKVVGAFPDGQSCLNLAAARLRQLGTSKNPDFVGLQPHFGQLPGLRSVLSTNLCGF